MYRAFFDYTPLNDAEPKYCFNTNHMVNVLSKFFINSNKEECEFYIIVDVHNRINAEEIINLRKLGKKIVLFTYDPPNFHIIDDFIENKMLDKVIVFDSLFKDRFKINSFVTDYVFDNSLFTENNIKNEDKVCYIGNISSLINRNNKYNLPVISKTVDNYKDLYKKMTEYNGVMVYDTGFNEGRTGLIGYNKAKAVEGLMCGINSYCQPGIKTKRYNQFLKKYEQISNPVPIDFDQTEIFKINKETIEELIYEMNNI